MMHPRYLRLSRLLFLSVMAIAAGCSQPSEEVPPAEPPRFSLLSPEETGITFENTLEIKEDWNIIEYLYYYNGGGVSAGDIDNDGWIDLYFTSNEGSNKLYRNLGEWKFEDVTEKAGVGTKHWSTGSVMVDVNGDGWLDIYVCQVGNYKNQQGQNRLFINQGNGTFSDEAEAYGLDFSGLSTQAAFFDFDRDGDLDMYLLNHSVHSVENYGPATGRRVVDSLSGDRLFRNLARQGEQRFVDATKRSKIYSSKLGYGLGIAVLDYDRDGWLDLYISNDFHENDYLYRNEMYGNFRDVAEDVFGHTSRYSMGNDVADINGDGYPEIVSLDMLPGDGKILRKSAAEDRNEVSSIKAQYGYAPQQVRNAVQINRQGEQFSDIAPLLGVHATDWSWAPLLADFDNDGNKDLYITNGIARRPNDLDYIQYLANAARSRKDVTDVELIAEMPELKISNYMYSRVQEDVTTTWGLEYPSFSNGSVYADLDRDGDLDLVVNNINQSAFIFQNKSDEKNHWVGLILKGDKYNPNALGSQVSVYAGGKEHYEMISATKGFLSGVPAELHVGLGEVSRVDSVFIRWTDGSWQMEYDLSVDSLHTVEKSNVQRGRYFQLNTYNDQSKVLNLARVEHQENLEYKDFHREHLIPENLSMEGPAVAFGDVNGDGFEDFYLGAAHGVIPRLFTFDGNKFEEKTSATWLNEQRYEDTDAVFFDADKDGDLDLYVVSGGNEYPEGHFLLEDRLFLNDGTGEFTRAEDRIPELAGNGGLVRPYDIDKDGDEDLFIGQRSVPGSYGMPPESYLLINEDGRFEVDKGFRFSGMVTDAAWYDAGGTIKLFAVGDWMPVTIISSTSEGWSTETIDGTRGLWRSIWVGDSDSDGATDILVGNLGLNTPLSSNDEQAALFLADFDGNGQSDPILLQEKQGKMIPFAAKDDLDKQLPMLKKDFTSYEAFAIADDWPEYFRSLSTSNESWIDTFAHLHIEKSLEGWEITPLPEVTQWTTINYIHQTADDVLLAGNSFRPNIALGKIDALPLMKISEDQSGWQVMSTFDYSDVSGDFRMIQPVETTAGDIYWLIFRNNDSVLALNSED